MNKFLAILYLSLFFCGCNTISINDLNEQDKITVLPTLNFSGFDLTQFPGTVYRDAELAKMFSKVETNTLDFSEILENKLHQRLANTNANIVLISNKYLDTTDFYDQETLKHIQMETPFDYAFFCVVTQLSMKHIFTKKELYIELEIACINDSGSLKQKASKAFVIHLPDSIFTPLGVDFSRILSQICDNILDELT